MFFHGTVHFGEDLTETGLSSEGLAAMTSLVRSASGAGADVLFPQMVWTASAELSSIQAG